MGKKWDYDVPSVEVWQECLRVLKPGGHLLAFAGTRTQHRMAVRIEDAGFEIRDMIAWVYGSGFPKSLDVSKAIDKAAGAEREVVGNYGRSFRPHGENTEPGWDRPSHDIHGSITAPATEAARQWQGWGTALKPALEPITVARKPLGEKTVAANVLKHGTGAINVDGCRVVKPDGDESGWSKTGSKAGQNRSMSGANYEREPKPDASGRWPSNLIHDGSEEVLAGFPVTTSGGGDKTNKDIRGEAADGIYGTYKPNPNARQHNLDTGSSARFFKECQHEKTDLLFCGAKTTIKAWQDQNQIQPTADIANYPLSLQEALESIVQKVAAIWPSLAGILSKDSTTPSTSVTASEFETLCATVTTTMTSIGSGFSQESQQEKLTPFNSLVKCVATQKQTGITTITVSLLRSDGFAESATLNITLLNTGLGEAASRFKYCAKASKKDRDEGCEGEPEKASIGDNRPSGTSSERRGRIEAERKNNHPTVKPTALMRYLCRLVTPPEGIVLDPFMGSGSTGKAAVLEGFRFIGIEREEEYLKIAESRIAAATMNVLDKDA
jgi:hypothetical protein